MLKLFKNAAPEATLEPAAKPAKGADQLAVEMEVNAIIAAQADLAQQRQGFRDGHLTVRLQQYLAESSPAELRHAVRAALQRRLEMINRVHAIEAAHERRRRSARGVVGPGGHNF